MIDSLLKKKLDTYLENGGVHCPFCESSDIQAEPARGYAGGLLQEVSCLNCEAVWEDNYMLTSISIESVPEGAMIEENT